MIALAIAKCLGKHKRKGNGYLACCPAHDDTEPSLSIDERDGQVLVHCFAGCSQHAVLTALRQKGVHLDSDCRPQRAAYRPARQNPNLSAVWDVATAATDGCAYLRRKAVKAHGLRYFRNAVLVPMRDMAGNLRGILRIYPNGSKRILPGSHTTGAFHQLGDFMARIICLAEGYATAAAIYESTGICTLACFTCGNLMPVAETIRNKYPDATIIIAADDDHHHETNPGLTAATITATAVGGLLAVPTFPAPREPSATDFNDLLHIAGANAVRACINGAKEVCDV